MKRERPLPRGLRLLAWIVLAAAGLLLLWQLVAELIEPCLLLSVVDWLHPPAPPGQVAGPGDTTLRLYPDTRPHGGKMAGLQKGLVWVRQGQELVEEGLGFGSPIIVRAGRAYLSRQAEIEVVRHGEDVSLVKRYTIDTLETPTTILQRKFRPVPPLGVVTFRYDVQPDGIIEVTVDFSPLNGPWDLAYLMNEQGAERFTRYRDASGRSLAGERIGIWEPVRAARACFDSADGRLGFCLELEEPAQLYYGREFRPLYTWRGVTYLAWSGVDIAVPGGRSSYHYRILLEVR